MKNACCPGHKVGKFCAVFGCWTNSEHKAGIVHAPFKKSHRVFEELGKIFVKTSRKNLSVPTSYIVICALHVIPSCFQDQFTTDLRAEAGYWRRKLNKDAVPALLTEK